MKKPHEITGAQSTVMRCAHCNTWYARFPSFSGCDDFAECDKCGCTSFKYVPGRVYGPKSKHWKQVLLDWIELYDCLDDWQKKLVTYKETPDE